MPQCVTDRCIEPARNTLFCRDCEIRERIKVRWDRVVDWNPKLKRLVVHPSDWKMMGYPLDYRALPVKPLGVSFISHG